MQSHGKQDLHANPRRLYSQTIRHIVLYLFIWIVDADLPLQWTRQAPRNQRNRGPFPTPYASLLPFSHQVYVLIIQRFEAASEGFCCCRWDSKLIPPMRYLGPASHIENLPLVLGQSRYWIKQPRATENYNNESSRQLIKRHDVMR